MALHDDFEGICGRILHRIPLPFVDLIVNDFLAKEMHFKSHAEKGILPAPNSFVLVTHQR